MFKTIMMMFVLAAVTVSAWAKLMFVLAAVTVSAMGQNPTTQPTLTTQPTPTTQPIPTTQPVILLSFSIKFKPKQYNFSIDEYKEKFMRALKIASMNGNTIVVRGHSDPTCTVATLFRSGEAKGIINKTGSKEEGYAYLRNGKPLNNQFIELIKSGELEGGKYKNKKGVETLYYTDTLQFAVSLSIRRAYTVKASILEMAHKENIVIDESQIRVEGVGIREPVVIKPKNVVEAGQNRRVEIHVVKIPAEAIKKENSAIQNVVIVLDDSGSMADQMRKNNKITRMDAAKTALHIVVNQVSPDTKLGILLLNKGWIVLPSKINKEEVNKKIDKIVPAGGTPLGKNMKIGADALLEIRTKEGAGVYKLLIVTDGEESDKNLVNQYLMGNKEKEFPGILKKRITVDVIGVDMKATHSLATKVKKGRYKRADDVKEITEAISDVFSENTGTDYIGEDYAEIAAIPDEVVLAAIKALTFNDNIPIGEKRKVSSSGSVVLATTTGEGSGVGWTILYIIGGILVVIIVCIVGREICNL